MLQELSAYAAAGRVVTTYAATGWIVTTYTATGRVVTAYAATGWVIEGGFGIGAGNEVLQVHLVASRV